jgi:hypothetical protein
MQIRPYDPDKDFAQTFRVFLECSWAQDTDEQRDAMRMLLEPDTTFVALLDGEVESVASNVLGEVYQLGRSLDLCVVGGVATSRVARRQQLATRVTAEALAHDVAVNGSLVAELGMFEQGFYDRLGFGTGAPIPWMWLDPGTIRVDAPRRAPVRLGMDDWMRVHESRLRRRPRHGACSITTPNHTRHDMMVLKQPFGLGFVDSSSGELTHHIWCVQEGAFSGPVEVRWMAWRTPEQFRELMALLGSLGEQTRLLKMAEPPGIQLQDLLHKPFQRMQSGWEGKFGTRTRYNAYTQLRICDLPGCLERTRLRSGESVTFHLTLTDPIEEHLRDAPWRGIGGEYVVTLGPESHAEPGKSAAGLPAMRTSVNTFSRLWHGVRSPTALAHSCADLEARADLLETLDRVLAMPTPLPDWDY